MGQFFTSLPKTVLALGVIIIGFIVIIISDPPKTDCDSQLELFQKEQGDFLYGQKNGVSKQPLSRSFFQNCQSLNSPGGCFEFFVRLKKLNQDLASIPKKCSETMAEDKILKSWLLKSMKLMAEISWGDKGPASIARRNAWFDTSDLSLFCGLKKRASQLYGVEAVDAWREEVLGLLPEAAKLDHEQLFQKSLFATACEAYR